MQVRAEDTAENMYAAIENVADTVARKMRKVKEKAIAHGNWDGTAGPRGHSFSKVCHIVESAPLMLGEQAERLSVGKSYQEMWIQALLHPFSGCNFCACSQYLHELRRQMVCGSSGSKNPMQDEFNNVQKFCRNFQKSTFQMMKAQNLT